MSRSYKKPYITDGSKGRKRSGRSMKDFANKTIRHSEDIPTRERGAYKKLFCSYEICDYKWHYTVDQATEAWFREEQEYPKQEKYYVLDKDEHGKCVVDENDVVQTHAVWRTIEEGYLHKKYKTLQNYLNSIKKDYYRK
jgi:hypothetical protein